MAEQSPVINLAFTGASGAQYGLRLLQCLVANGCRVNVMISKAAQVVIATETEFRLPGSTPAMAEALSDFAGAQTGQVQVFGREEWFSPPASGSGEKAPLVICPCSTGTLSALATGASNNLIERAGDVALKERRKLILVLRETPYSEVHLENMLRLTRMGAVMMPASPGFYHNPQSVDDLVDFMVARILDHLDFPQTLVPRWGEKKAD
ncbi:flavin prenyltransferase UbiX [Marinobacter nauticus]|uniref:Flavin prenyltransferase UbiX n=1 Tax=Marinobacter nauticus TaxID=2743 RepID=A0A833JPU1_MARNT|nr:flavin prenyltransferase UbiX [Marinobacter nauticus]KAE8545311.1 Flavin prenyltransferase UbiX [Marinobacter nauticus]